MIGDRFRTLAVDCLGAGRSPPFPAKGNHEFEAEIMALNCALGAEEERFALVGHSYGGALAFHFARRFPHRVRAIAVYEPTLFAPAAAAFPDEDVIKGIREISARAAELCEIEETDSAARVFIDFWSNPGAYDNMSAGVQAYVRKSISDVNIWRETLLGDRVPLSAYSAIDCPILVISGTESPRSSLAVTEVLVPTLPRVVHHEMKGLGHMGPITDPHRVNRRILDFLNGSEQPSSTK